MNDNEKPHKLLEAQIQATIKAGHFDSLIVGLHNALVHGECFKDTEWELPSNREDPLRKGEEALGKMFDGVDMIHDAARVLRNLN